MANKPWTTERVAYRALLREVRAESSLTQVELARAINRPQSFVSSYENGERKLDLIELQEIVEACGSNLVSFCKRYERAVKP